MRVLIVEDHQHMLSGLTQLVRSLGHEPVPATTVADALAALASPPASVVLDLTLPDGHGTAVLERVRANHLPVRVAVFTSAADPALLDEARRLGPDAVFQKHEVSALLAWLGHGATAASA